MRVHRVCTLPSTCAHIPVECPALVDMYTPRHARYFYDHIAQIAAELGVDFAKLGRPEEWLTIYDGQGDGYAVSKWYSTNQSLFVLFILCSRSHSG